MVKFLNVVVDNYNNSYNYNREILQLGDIDTLLQFLNNTVSIKSFKGKVVFLENTTFPRFKLTEYSKKSTKIKRTIKLSTADALVVDTNAIKEELEKYKKSLYIFKLKANGHYSEKIYQPLVDTINSGDIQGTIINKYCYGNSKNIKHQIDALIEVYNNYPNIPILSVRDLTQEISSDYEAITEEWATNLESLLASPDQNAVKLAMSYITNANFEDSLFYSLMLINKHWNRVRGNPYYSSTNFKAFIKNLDSVGFCTHFFGQSTTQMIQCFLKVEGKKIMKSSIPFIHKNIREEVETFFSYSARGYKLENYEIKLNLKDEDIIDDGNIETEDETMLEPIENTSDNDKYLLVDDTQHND